MVNYQLGKMYKIIDNTNENVYVGSTCEPTLARRLSRHVANYKCYLKGTYKYTTSFEIIKNNDYDIILIENYPCNTKDELYARERYWTNQIKCVNKIKNQGIQNELGLAEYKKKYGKQYREENQDKMNEYKKKYLEENKDKLSEKTICECGGKFIHSHKSEHLKTKKHINYLNSL